MVITRKEKKLVAGLVTASLAFASAGALAATQREWNGISEVNEPVIAARPGDPWERYPDFSEEPKSNDQYGYDDWDNWGNEDEYAYEGYSDYDYYYEEEEEDDDDESTEPSRLAEKIDDLLSSGGCNSGFGALALPLAGLAAWRRRRGR